MPTYDYDCMTCQTTVEVVHAMSRRHEKIKCEKCGNIRRKRAYGLPYKPSEISDPSQPAASVEPEEIALGSHAASLSGNEVYTSTTALLQDKDGVDARERPKQEIMPEEPRLADDIDPNKLLVEIVQGLLMAHARLDHMEAALRQAVESASLEHLKSFDKNLSIVDLRFKQTTADAGKAVASLEKVRDNLVRSVQEVSIEHYDVFKSDVAAIQVNIDHLRTEGVLSLAADIKANRLAERQRFDEMLNSLKHLSSNDAALKSSGLAESTKQAENWKNIYQFLQGFQKATSTSAADLKKHTTDETKSLSRQMNAAVELINTLDANQYADIRRVRILLYWLIFFSASLIALIAATTFRFWIR